MTRNRLIKIYSALAIRLLDGAIAHAILAVASEHAVLSTHNLGHAVAFFVDIAHTIGFDFALRLRQQIVPNLRQDALQLGIFFIADAPASPSMQHSPWQLSRSQKKKRSTKSRLTSVSCICNISFLFKILILMCKISKNFASITAPTSKPPGIANEKSKAPHSLIECNASLKNLFQQTIISFQGPSNKSGSCLASSLLS